MSYLFPKDVGPVTTALRQAMARANNGDVALKERPPVAEPPKVKAKTPEPIADKPMPDVAAEMEAYDALCAELGFAPTARLDDKRMREADRVRQIFHSKRIPIYDKSEVADYMTSITPKGLYWGWVQIGGDAAPARFSNLSRNFIGLGGSETEEVLAAQIRRANGSRIAGSYDKLIPMHILKRIKVVKELFNAEDPKFYVTDYAVPDPDPFVKVVIASGQEVIFGMWDEPGFGDLKTEV